jgi:hypothetical protein
VLSVNDADAHISPSFRSFENCWMLRAYLAVADVAHSRLAYRHPRVPLRRDRRERQPFASQVQDQVNIRVGQLRPMVRFSAPVAVAVVPKRFHLQNFAGSQVTASVTRRNGVKYF